MALRTTPRPAASRRVLRAAVVVLAGGLMIAAPALAQNQPGGPRGRGERGLGPALQRTIGRLMQPEFLRRDVEIMQRELSLDASQVLIAESLIDQYTADFEAARDGIRDRMQALRPGDDEQREALRERMREMGELRREIVELRRSVGNNAEPTPEQRQAMRALTERAEAMRAEMAELRPQRPSPEEMRGLMEEMSAITDRWQSIRASLRDELLADVRVTLEPSQVERWPAFERALRRSKSLPRGRIAGESVDLAVLARRIGSVGRGDALVAERLDAWAIELDQALLARDAFLEDAFQSMGRAFMDEDYETALEAARREAELRVAVRTVNERHLEALGTLLEEGDAADRAEALRAAWLEQAFPRVTGPTPVDRSFDAAMEMLSGDPEALAELTDLRSGYEAGRRDLETRIIEATRAEEPAEMVRRIEWRVARMNDQEPPDRPTARRDAMEEATEFERTTRERIEALLTPEQIAELPAMRRLRGPGGGPEGRRDRDRMDDAERAERRARARRIMAEFDADGDGELSEEEREAFREAFRQRRGPGGPGRDGRGGDRDGGGGAGANGGPRGGRA